MTFEEALRRRPARDSGDAPGELPRRAPAPAGRASSTGPCHVCQGTGAVRSVRGHMVFSRSCTACGGTGQQRRGRASRAAAAARRRAARRVQVRIPPGVADGDRVRVPGKGNAGLRGGAAGRSLRHGARRAASRVPPRGRRPAHGGADRDPRSGARREDRRSHARRQRPAARAAGHAVGPALPPARARRAVDAGPGSAAIWSSRCA